MIKVKKYGCEYNIDKKSLASVNVTYDGLQLVMNDGTELRFTFQVTNQLKAIISVLKSTPIENVVLDVDAAINGLYDKVLILTSIQTPENIPHIVVNPPTTEKKTEETPTEKPKKGFTKNGKKIGRPPAKKA